MEAVGLSPLKEGYDTGLLESEHPANPFRRYDNDMGSFGYDDSRLDDGESPEAGRRKDQPQEQPKRCSRSTWKKIIGVLIGFILLNFIILVTKLLQDKRQRNDIPPPRPAPTLFPANQAGTSRATQAPVAKVAPAASTMSDSPTRSPTSNAGVSIVGFFSDEPITGSPTISSFATPTGSPLPFRDTPQPVTTPQTSPPTAPTQQSFGSFGFGGGLNPPPTTRRPTLTPSISPTQPELLDPGLFPSDALPRDRTMEPTLSPSTPQQSGGSFGFGSGGI